MKHIQLHAITDDGPRMLDLPAESNDIHQLFDPLPVGVYTSLRTFDHHYFLHLADHLDRLQESIALLGWDYEVDQRRLRLALNEVCRAYPDINARVRLDVLARDVSWPGFVSRELIGLFPYTPVPEKLYRSGVQVAIASQLTRENPKAKQAQFAQRRRQFLADDPDSYECLLLDEAGYILEGTTSNFYAVREGALWTAGEGMLEGVARKIVLQMAKNAAIPVRLEAIHIDEIGSVDECALSSSSRAIIPIVGVAGQVVGDGRPGRVVRRLLTDYNTYVAGAIMPAAL